MSKHTSTVSAVSRSVMEKLAKGYPFPREDKSLYISLGRLQTGNSHIPITIKGDRDEYIRTIWLSY